MTTQILVGIMYMLFFNGGSELKDLSLEFIKAELGLEVSIEFEEYIIPGDIRANIQGNCKQAFFRDGVYIYRVFKDESLTNIAILDNVQGKSLPITFLVIFDLKGEVVNSSVLKYREPYGGAVAEPSWLKQFEGKNIYSEFGVGSDISAISGATISVNSLTRGIRKLVLLQDYLIKK